MAKRFARSMWSEVGRSPRRLRWLVPALSLVLVGTLTASLPAGAAPNGAAVPGKDAPKQETWAGTDETSATTEDTQGRQGPGAPAPKSPKHPAPVLSPRQPDGADATPSPLDLARQDAVAHARWAGRDVEVESARTPRSTEFAHSDGTRSTRLYENVSFVPGDDGALRPVDGTLNQSQSDGRLRPVAATSASFAPVTDPELAHLDLAPGISIGFGLDDAAVVGAEMDGAVARYSGVREDSDLELSASEAGIKEELILHSSDAPTTWFFPLRAEGVMPLWHEESGSVRFTDVRGIVRATVPPGFMEDSSFDDRSGAPARSNDVRYTLLKRDGGWVLRVDLDAAWLSDPARIFPVRVDPTYVSTTLRRMTRSYPQGTMPIGTTPGVTNSWSARTTAAVRNRCRSCISTPP